ncbi:hypothetical protein QVD17_08354 [Tagetes erecta]|uniref:Uncharacterized protein n=1 Tax=Tagetes erecta TaxID=13708 RepID=A0AAD8P4K6_TARER|nr:hypothetical protein QVD17_08354 [Tagetes erecta]
MGLKKLTDEKILETSKNNDDGDIRMSEALSKADCVREWVQDNQVNDADSSRPDNGLDSDPFDLDKFIFCGPVKKKRSKMSLGRVVSSSRVSKNSNSTRKKANKGNSLSSLSSDRVDDSLRYNELPTMSYVDPYTSQQNSEKEPINTKEQNYFDPETELVNTLQVGEFVQIDLTNHSDMVRELVTADAEKVLS